MKHPHKFHTSLLSNGKQASSQVVIGLGISEARKAKIFA